MHADLMKAISDLQQLETLVKAEDSVKNAAHLRAQTDKVASQLQTIVDDMKVGNIVLEKDETIVLMSAIENVFSLLSSEVNGIKDKIRKAKAVSQAHKLYSGQ